MCAGFVCRVPIVQRVSNMREEVVCKLSEIMYSLVIVVAVLVAASCTDTDSLATDLHQIADDFNQNLNDGQNSSGSGDGVDAADGVAGTATDGSGNAEIDGAVQLIDAAIAATTGLSSRGEVTVHMPDGGADSKNPKQTEFKQDGKGSVIMEASGVVSEIAADDGSEVIHVEIPEVRYIDGVAYMRIPIDVAEEAGMDVASIRRQWVWVKAERGSAEAVDTVSDYPFGLLCDFILADELAVSSGKSSDCHPASAAVSVVEAAADAQIAGHEKVGDDVTTKISFTVPLQSLTSRSSSLYKGARRDIIRDLGSRLSDSRSLSNLPDMDDLSQIVRGVITDLVHGAHRFSLRDMADILRGVMAGLFQRDMDISVEAHVWIDDDMRIRRLSYSLESVLESLKNTNLKVIDKILGYDINESIFDDISAGDVIIEYHDFGVELAIEAPPEEQVRGDYDLLAVGT